MRIYIIAGEESGDVHGSNLVSELILKNNDVNIRAWGGDRMKSAGANVIKHINDISFMGFSQVLLNIGHIYQNLISCRQDIISFKPDAIILIDYPGFNLRIARFAKKNGIKVFYYISPKVWAWRSSRIELIKRYVDRLIVIFPFEVDFFKKHGVIAHYFGNPISDEINKELSYSRSPSVLEFNALNKGSQVIDMKKDIIALMPGSRRREVKMNLPTMLLAARHSVFDKKYQFVIASTDNTYDLCKKILTMDSESSSSDSIIVKGRTYKLLRISRAAVVTSGTATLEAAMFNVPQVVCYKTDFLTYYLAKKLVKLEWISLVNIILNKMAVPELIQEDMNAENLQKELLRLLSKEKNKDIIDAYKSVNKNINGHKVSSKVAEFILNNI